MREHGNKRGQDIVVYKPLLVGVWTVTHDSVCGVEWAGDSISVICAKHDLHSIHNILHTNLKLISLHHISLHHNVANSTDDPQNTFYYRKHNYNYNYFYIGAEKANIQ